MTKKFLLFCVMAAAAGAAYAQTTPASSPMARPAQGLTAIDKAPEAPAKAPASRADETETEVTSLDFSLSFKVEGGLAINNLPVGSTVYQAFEFSEANRKLFDGKTIKSINVCSGTNTRTGKNDMTDVTVFLTQDLDGEFFYTQQGKLGTTRYTYYPIELNTPYVIDATKPLYVGYYSTVVSANDNYLVVDAVPRTVPDGGYYGSIGKSNKPEWDNLASAYGNLCLGVTLVGENFPTDGVNVQNLALPPYTAPGEKFKFDVTFVGAACNEADSVEIAYSFGEAEPVNLKIPFSEDHYLAYNQVATYTITADAPAEPNIDTNFLLEVTKVNGKDNTATQNTASATLVCMPRDNGFARNFVMEEGTGTWCQYCPAGMVMMEYLKEKYPERFVRVAVHSGDNMQTSSTSEVLYFFTGFPMAMVDRSIIEYPTDPNINRILDSYYSYYTQFPAIAGIDNIEVASTGDDKVSISSSVKFGLDYANHDRFRMSYYITEDNVGPDVQTNGYAGGSDVMGGWENKPGQVAMMFDDVARLLIGGAYGVSNSLPAQIEQATAYNYSTEASLANVTGDTYFVTAMVVDSTTGEIVNARQIEAKKESASVESVSTAATKVVAENGAIKIVGQYTTATVYSVSGIALGTLNGEAAMSVAPGLYIVVCDGISHKIAVK